MTKAVSCRGCFGELGWKDTPKRIVAAEDTIDLNGNLLPPFLSHDELDCRRLNEKGC